MKWFKISFAVLILTLVSCKNDLRREITDAWVIEEEDKNGASIQDYFMINTLDFGKNDTCALPYYFGVTSKMDMHGKWILSEEDGEYFIDIDHSFHPLKGHYKIDIDGLNKGKFKIMYLTSDSIKIKLHRFLNWY